VPRILLGVNALVAVAFVLVLYVVPRVPPADGPAVAAAAPDFTAIDQTGRTVRLADFRGSPLLLVFYRGHW
jgi:cytochrome oxidase Cu insertion factor (SCO1/SenC/PrrC family)